MAEVTNTTKTFNHFNLSDNTREQLLAFKTELELLQVKHNVYLENAIVCFHNPSEVKYSKTYGNFYISNSNIEFTTEIVDSNIGEQIK